MIMDNREKKRNNKIKMVWSKLQWLNDDDFTLDEIRREIALTVFEIPAKKTGYVSKSLCVVDESLGHDKYGQEQGYRVTGKGVKSPCHEHFLNMKKYTIQMCEEFIAGKIDSVEKLTKKINQITMVHLVTSEENNKLRTVQTKHPEKSWKEHYNMVGIELIKEVGTFNKDNEKYRKTYE